MNNNARRIAAIYSILFIVALIIPSLVGATSQWARKTGMSCNACHSVFPRLNSYGEDFLRDGYPMSKGKLGSEGTSYVDKIDNLLGFRLNVSPFIMETNTFQKDDGADKETKYSLGTPHWIQFFVAGQIYNNVSFFSELEYASSSFKFAWFYFNFTNVLNSEMLNFQVGNISPVEYASYPDRLGQFPNIKGEVFHIKPANGGGETQKKIRDGHYGIQYYGKFGAFLPYFGMSPSAKSQYFEKWGGLVFKLPGGILEGSTATIHYHMGTETKNTGKETSGDQKAQVTDEWTRIVPSINLRYNEKLDVQAAYMIAEDKNWSLVSDPTESFKYSGVALDAGYLLNDSWHAGVHYDQYVSENETDGKPILEYKRVVPVVTYIINHNIRISAYYEKDITPDKTDPVDKIYLNLRTMF